MKTIHVLDSTGDSAIAFGETDTKATEEARALFDRLKKEGRTAFDVSGGADVPAPVVKSFDELGEKTIIIPHVVGG